MNGNPPTTLREQREKQNLLLEVFNAEKLLWPTIQHKGISHSEVQDLYRKARSGYENIILKNYQSMDLQEVEYSLWKLHYKHIDEFRKSIKKVSGSAESSNNLNTHIEKFKLFLFEVAEFYKDLIAKFRKTCGISEETFLFKKSGNSVSLEKCHYVCHRFLVCLGDVSRYMELCRKSEAQNWAIAATYYLEASTVWPYSGNPQNQLALLATYVGDDFLALYHCVRSLAVKEPFPDARDNIMIIFEKNKSSQLKSLSTDAHIDFSKPLKRLSSQIKSQSSLDSTNINRLGANEHVSIAKTDLWPLFVRMISFFLVKPSFEDLPHTFASTMKELEALLALNDTELNSALEAYDHFDSSRKGPYRPLQAVSILIFIIHNLIKTPQQKDLKGQKDEQLSACTSWAWTCTFTCLGHFIQRCITNNSQESQSQSSLLPAVLVFVEWFVNMVDQAESYGKDEKVCNAKSYFFSALIDLLSGFDVKIDSTSQIALWEDYELTGFEPVNRLTESLDFVTRSEHRRKFEMGNGIRANRIVNASIKIAERLKGYSQNLIVYDESSRKFYASQDPEKSVFWNSKKNEDSSGVEEEEVILFKPLTRHNSEPIQTSIHISSDEIIKETETSEESLRRSSSLIAAQKGYSAGPPSLSGWVLNRESLNLEKERGSRNSNTRELSPISEVSTSEFGNLSISESTPYIAPIPSAPFLPEEHGILGAPPVTRLSNFSSPQEMLLQPPVYGLSSSEWLYRYTNNLSLERGNGIGIGIGNGINVPNSNHHWAVNPSGNLHGYDGGARFDVIDGWGNQLLTNRMVYFENPNLGYGKDEKLSFGYQRPFIGGVGGAGGGEVRGEQLPVLQHLKEREWQVQSEAPVRGNPYMGN